MNAAKCLICNEVLRSKSRHDFRMCSCGNMFVDGGEDYVRRGAVYPSSVLEIRTEAEYAAAVKEAKP